MNNNEIKNNQGVKDIKADFEIFRNGEVTAIRELSMELATKEGAKSYNKNSKIALAIAYIITELSVNGEMKDIKRENIEVGSTATRVDANAAVKRLVDKGLVLKYKKVNQVVDKRGKITNKFRFDKYVYTLIATNALYTMIEDKGYSVSFDRSLLNALQTAAAKESEKVVSVIKKDRNGVVSTDKTTTDARGNRTKETSVDMDSVNQALENAKAEYEKAVSEINEAALQDGKVQELSPVEPLVSKEDILNMDNEEFKEEQEASNDEAVEGNVEAPATTSGLDFGLNEKLSALLEEDEDEELEWLELEDDEEDSESNEVSNDEVVEANVQAPASTCEDEFLDFDGEVTEEELSFDMFDNEDAIEASSNEVVEGNVQEPASTVEEVAASNDNAPEASSEDNNDLDFDDPDFDPEAQTANVTFTGDNMGKHGAMKANRTNTSDEPKSSTSTREARRNMRKGFSNKPVLANDFDFEDEFQPNANQLRGIRKSMIMEDRNNYNTFNGTRGKLPTSRHQLKK